MLVAANRIGPGRARECNRFLHPCDRWSERSLGRFSELADVLMLTSKRALHAGFMYVPDVNGLFENRVLLSLNLYKIRMYASRVTLFRTAATHVRYDQERKLGCAWMAHAREIGKPRQEVEKVHEIAMQCGLGPRSLEAKIRLLQQRCGQSRILML